MGLCTHLLIELSFFGEPGILIGLTFGFDNLRILKNQGPQFLTIFQSMVDTVTLEIGLSVLLNVEEELRQDQEPAQTLLLQTEELTV